MQNLSLITMGLAIMLGSTALKAQEQDNLHSYTRDEENIHMADDFKGVEIHNQHGEIEIKAWLKDTILIKIETIVMAEYRDMADEVFDRLNINKTTLAGMAFMRTAFDEEFHSSHPFRINYEVFMPANKKIKIINRFGNVTITDITGKMDIKLEYGNIIQSGLQKADTIITDLSFGEAQLSKINYSKAELHNSGVKIDNVNSAVISGKYCQVDIEEAGSLDFSNHTARINIGKVKELNLNGQFCFVSVDELMKRGKIEISDGLLITSLSEQTTEFSVFNENAPANINISPKLSYTLHGEVSDGNFRHDNQRLFKTIREPNKISFSGEYVAENKKLATLILFNRNAGINIKTKK
ncbi:hypothetical protein [Marinilabilia salmonicolor]|uniref:hypothetical protein n=1 Tax=Marinilabilia salmonicolor TaxID=989 RepID=UPI00046AACFD|nr:hypothetical protein [Marinilabilia salmonicolor]